MSGKKLGNGKMCHENFEKRKFKNVRKIGSIEMWDKIGKLERW